MNAAKLREMSESLAQVGQLQPIRVVARGERFEVIVGHRRLVAAQRLGWDALRAEVVEATDREILRERIHENAKREDLSPLERAIEARDAVAECEGDIEGAALMLGVSVPTVEAWLQVLGWPRDVQEALDAGHLGRGAAAWLAKIADAGEREEALRTAVRDGCTEALGRWWYQEWVKKGVLPTSPNDRSAGVQGRVLLRDPTWPCYLCLDELSFANLYTVRVCPHCAPIIAANREEGKPQDPNLGLLG